MSTATRWLAGVLAVGFLAAAVVSFLQFVLGERSDSYMLTCVFLGVGVGCGWFSWSFEPGLHGAAMCSDVQHADDSQSMSGREGSDAA